MPSTEFVANIGKYNRLFNSSYESRDTILTLVSINILRAITGHRTIIALMDQNSIKQFTVKTSISTLPTHIFQCSQKILSALF